MEVTEDFILNGTIRLFQPKYGYRAAIDPILLANSVQTERNQSVLDVGCGVGTISLILKKRDPSQNITAMDVDVNMLELCRKNSECNKLPLNVVNHGVDTEFLKNESFDCVVTNPPFYGINNFRISEAKKTANFETVDLKTWLTFCLKRLKPKGNLYMIHLTERLPEVLIHLAEKVGKIEITPLYSRFDSPTKRIILACRKGSREPLRIMPPLSMHSRDEINK